MKEKDIKQGPMVDPFPPIWCDPAPPWMIPWNRYQQFQEYQYPRIPRIPDPGDPALEMLLDKAKVAQIKVIQLDKAIEQMQKNMDFLILQRDMLKKEYKL